MRGVRSALFRWLALPAALAAAPVALATQPPRLSATTPGAAAPAAQATPLPGDPFAEVWLVTSRHLFEGGIGRQAQAMASRRDGAGNDLVLARARNWQLDAISHGIHVREQHCGGYFAFATRAEAETFLRGDRSRQALHGKALADYGIDNQATVAPWLAQVRDTEILATIRHLSTAWPNRYYASRHGHDAALWIRDHWQALAQGRDDVEVELFTACSSCGGQPSVILTVHGQSLANEIVVVGGHLDSISNSGSGDGMVAPGADDDASGIATISEIIRVALRSGWKPRRTLKFMGYAAEEVGLRGSNAIAQSFRSQGLQVVGVLQLDMTNHSAGSAYAMRLMTDNSSPVLQDFVARLFDTYLAPRGLSRGQDTCGYACSDHAAWTAAGYPAAMMIEPSFFTRLHTTTDTLAYLGEQAIVSANFARLGLAFIGELGKTHAPPRWRRDGAQPLAPPSSAAALAAMPAAPARTRPQAPARAVAWTSRGLSLAPLAPLAAPAWRRAWPARLDLPGRFEFDRRGACRWALVAPCLPAPEAQADEHEAGREQRHVQGVVADQR